MSDIYPVINDSDYTGDGYFTGTVRFAYGSLRSGQFLILKRVSEKPQMLLVIGGMTVEGMRHFTPTYDPYGQFYIPKWRLMNIQPREGA
jgi:hypothetical protein